jgi:hypothetical protein
LRTTFADLGQQLSPASRLGLSRAAGLDRRGRVTDWPSRPDWIGLDLLELMRTATGAAVIEHVDDSVATAVGAYLFSGGGTGETIAAISLGTGVAIGIVDQGKVRLTGDGRRTLAHSSLGHHELPCRCGRSGCIQALLCDPGLTPSLLRHRLQLLIEWLVEQFAVTRCIVAGGRAREWTQEISAVPDCEPCPAAEWAAAAGAAAFAAVGTDLRGIKLDPGAAQSVRQWEVGGVLGRSS